jgi:hypothetical protein
MLYMGNKSQQMIEDLENHGPAYALAKAGTYGVWVKPGACQSLENTPAQ